MLPFSALNDLVESRHESARAVEELLDRIRSGVLPDAAERARVDVKEEAGRRDRAGNLLPGQPHNLQAATQLADEVACFANTPGGGALVIGIDNNSGDLLGAALDAEWLRHRIYELIGVAPSVEEHRLDGVRLLVITVAMAPEPVEDTGNRIRWRVGAHCEPVDRSEWWHHRQELAGFDTMAAATTRTLADVSPGALSVARRYLRERVTSTEAGSESAEDLLRRLGALRSDGKLTQAGALVFCATDTAHLTLAALAVEGGDVLGRAPDLAGASLLEQLADVEGRLDTLNSSITVRDSFAERPVRRLPVSAVREAVLNGIVHRDWLSRDPITVTWVEEDSALQVVSPGGFVGGVASENVLTQRFARHPALADLFRALNLVDKQGLGVDRMYREMVVLGHRPPTIVEDEGPRVRTRLVGGHPVVPVMALAGRIEPAVRRQDVRVALVVDELMRKPFTTPERMAVVLQRTVDEAAEALETTAECRVDGPETLLRHVKGVWMLSGRALAIVEDMANTPLGRARGLLPYRRPSDSTDVVVAWLTVKDRITSGDHATITGMTSAGALNQLERMVEDGLLVRGTGRGRNAHFLPGPRLEPSHTM